MIKRMKKISLSLGLTLLVIASSSLIHGRPIKSEQEDPMMALPNEEQPAAVAYERLTVPYQQAHQLQYSAPAGYQISYQPEQTVAVKYQQQQPQSPQGEYILQQQPGAQSASTPEVKHEVVYYVTKPEGQPGAEQVVAGRNPQEEDCNKPQQPTEYVSVSSDAQEATRAAREYPGEIIYVSPNGETYVNGQSTANYNPDQLKERPQSSGAGMVSESSGLPATILTEVPIKDLPSNVLEKLKREYGVKVVATRERPGANLIINCDEDSNTVCARSPLAFTPPTSSGYLPSTYSFANPSSEEHQGRNPTESVVAELPAEHQPSGYVTENAVENPANPQNEFSARTEAHIVSDNQESHGSIDGSSEAAAQGRRAEVAQPDNESGFDVQPASEEQDSKLQTETQAEGQQQKS